MKKGITSILAIMTLLFCMNMQAQDTAQTGNANSVSVGAATLGVGAVYRNFHSVRLKGVTLPGTTEIWLPKEGPDSRVEMNEANIVRLAGNNAVMVNRQYLFGPTLVNKTVTEAYTMRGHGSWGNMESMAPIVSLGCDLYQNDSLTIGFLSNLQYYNMDTSTGSSPKQTTTKTYITYTRNYFGGILPGTAGEVPGFASGEGENTHYGNPGGRTKFDLQMWEIDLGLKAAYTMTSGLDLYVATGPSLTYADMESSSAGSHDNDLDYIFGFYASLGSSYWFNESYGLSFDVRYDEAFKHADTKFANMNLDSWSAILKFLFLF